MPPVTIKIDGDNQMDSGVSQLVRPILQGAADYTKVIVSEIFRL
jgi:hypothetical protein